MDVSKLKDKELADLRAQVALEYERRTASSSSRTQLLFYESVKNALAKYGIQCPPFTAVKKNSQVWQKFVIAQRKADDFLLAALGTPSDVEKGRAYHRLSSLVVMRCRAFPEAPTSFNLVLSQYEHVGAVFESAFPGYVAARLAKKVL